MSSPSRTQKPPARVRAIVRRLRDRLAGERGSMLIEVIVGAVIVVITGVAILGGLDGAQDTGGRNKARSEAATLAQQDQERLRSFKIDDLSNYHEVRTVPANGVNYSVDSRAVWVNDSSGVVSCTNSSTQANYLLITSKVTVPGTHSYIKSNKPVTEQSLVTPPPGTFNSTDGTLGVQVVNRNQTPLQGVPVSVTGPDSFSDSTNDLGCAVFGFIPQGPWTVTVTSGSLVGWAGDSPATGSVGVIGGASVLKKFELDTPATINASFDTKVGAAAPVSSKSTSASVANAKLPSPGFKSYTAGSAQNTIQATPLFPFLDGYGVYAGTCAANNPAAPPTNDSDYFDTVGTAANAKPDPGQTVNVTARMPAINLKVTNASNVALNNANVKVTPTDSGCSQTFTPQKTNSTGALPLPGYPFGSYSVCADDGASHKLVTALANIDPNGTATTTMKIPTSSATTSNCP